MVAVVTIAKIYGTSLGLPHPGLLPTKDEVGRAARVGERGDQDARAERRLGADGQVAATRRTGKKLAAVARARGARVVVIDETTA